MFVLSCSDRSKTAVPYTKNGNVTGWGTVTGKRWNVQSPIPIVACMKRTPEESKNPKEASLYPSDCIWR